MKISKGTIRPGTVLEVLENGIIKATAPGLFNVIDEPAKLPPIMPWFIGSNSNSFSKLKRYDEVWIMNFLDNPRQLYWFRKDKIKDNNENIPRSEENVEIICNREVGGEWCSIYFSDGSGWVISKGESIIKIRPDGTILLDTGLDNRCIDINGKNISIGSEGKSAHPAAYGDTTVEVLTSICSLLSKVATAALPTPFTAAIGSTIMTSLPGIMSKIPDIQSEHVTID
jgi:hypothetical protein